MTRIGHCTCREVVFQLGEVERTGAGIVENNVESLLHVCPIPATWLAIIPQIHFFANFAGTIVILGACHAFLDIGAAGKGQIVGHGVSHVNQTEGVDQGIASHLITIGLPERILTRGIRGEGDVHIDVEGVVCRDLQSLRPMNDGAVLLVVTNFPGKILHSPTAFQPIAELHIILTPGENIVGAGKHIRNILRVDRHIPGNQVVDGKPVVHRLSGRNGAVIAQNLTRLIQ